MFIIAPLIIVYFTMKADFANSRTMQPSHGWRCTDPYRPVSFNCLFSKQLSYT